MATCGAGSDCAVTGAIGPTGVPVDDAVAGGADVGALRLRPSHPRPAPGLPARPASHRHRHRCPSTPGHQQRTQQREQEQRAGADRDRD